MPFLNDAPYNDDFTFVRSQVSGEVTSEEHSAQKLTPLRLLLRLQTFSEM